MKMRKNKVKINSNKGFSLIEMILAMFVLTVGVLGGMVMILMGMTRDNSNRVDTTATNAAQAVLEQISGTPPNTDPTITITDCVPTSLNISTTGAASPGQGAPLTGSGDINWALGAVNGYHMDYTVCGTNGLKVVYDVRWNITTVGPPGSTGKLITVSARQPTLYKTRGLSFIPPVTLRTIVGM
jgi:prepilin-type N-terminal cleavage/methylation domain-containing protein